MPPNKDKRCFIHSDGTPGFIATGNVELLCSKSSCGPYGKAEFWCGDCCHKISTQLQYPTTRIGPTSSRTTLMDTKVSGNRGMTPPLIAISTLGGILVGIMLFLAIHFIVQRYKKMKEKKQRDCYIFHRQDAASDGDNFGEQEEGDCVVMAGS